MTPSADAKPALRAPYALLLLAWLFFMLRGISIVITLPLWGGFDEWLHYSYAAYLQRSGEKPTFDVPSVPKEVRDSLSLAPAESYDQGQPSFRDFWAGSGEETSARAARVREIKNDFTSAYTITSWQAQHPPLYYGVLSLFYSFLDGRGLQGSVQVLRLLSLFIASLGLIPTYLLFRLFLDENKSVLGLLFTAAYPATFVLLGHVTNDALAFPLLSAVIFLTLLQFKRGAGTAPSAFCGLALGLGILTKLYLMTALPAVLAVYAWLFWRRPDERRKTAAGLMVFGLTFTALCFPWLYQNWKLYGSWNPTVHAVMNRDLGLMDKWRAFGLVDWKSFLYSNLIGLVWAGNWAFVTFPSFIYKTAACLILAWGGAYVFAIFRRRDSRLLNSFPLVLFSAAFLAGLVQHQLNIRVAGNLDPTGGWYWSVLFPAQALLLFVTAETFLGSKTMGVLKAVVLLTYLTGLWAQLRMLLPFYTGLLSRQEIASSLTGPSFAWGEAFHRIALLNGVPGGLLPVLLVLEAGLAAFLLLKLRESFPSRENS